MRRFLSIVAICSGVLLAVYAISQMLHPVTAIQETEGTVVGIEDVIEENGSVTGKPIVQFTTSQGDVIAFSPGRFTVGPESPDYFSILIGDKVPVVYFPWAPQEAQLGTTSRALTVAVGVQIMIIIVSGLSGLVLVGVGTLDIIKVRIHSQRSLAGVIADCIVHSK